MAILLEQQPPISFGATRVISVDLSKQCIGALLTGNPIVTEVGIVTGYDDETGAPIVEATAHLSLTNKSLNAAVISVLGKNVDANKAVQFVMSGQHDEKTYLIQISVATNSNPAETLVYDLRVPVV